MVLSNNVDVSSHGYRLKAEERISKITSLPDSNKSITVNRGFTLMELMVAVTIIAILATITIPSYLIKRQRSDVAEALHMADTIRKSVTSYYYANLSFPANNGEAGVPEPELLIGNKITRMEVDGGVIHITLGNKASKPLQGKILSMRPAIVTGSPTSPISWLCGSDSAITGMEAIGENRTDLDNAVVPASCGN